MLPSVGYALFGAHSSSHQAHIVAPGGSQAYTWIHYSTSDYSLTTHLSGPRRPVALLIYPCDQVRVGVLGIDGYLNAQHHLKTTTFLPSDAGDSEAELPNYQHTWEGTS